MDTLVSPPATWKLLGLQLSRRSARAAPTALQRRGTQLGLGDVLAASCGFCVPEGVILELDAPELIDRTDDRP